MKSCATCPDRAEINPQYQGRPFHETPCLLCEIRDRGDGTVSYDDRIFYEDAITPETVRPWVDAWDELTLRQKEIARAKMVNPNSTKAEIMRLLNIPRMTFYREWKRIERVFDEFFAEKRSTRPSGIPRRRT